MFKFSATSLPINKICLNSFSLYAKTVKKTWFFGPIYTLVILPIFILWCTETNDLALTFSVLAAIGISTYINASSLHYIFSLADNDQAKLSSSLRFAAKKWTTTARSSSLFFGGLLLLLFLIFLISACMAVLHGVSDTPKQIELISAIDCSIWLILAGFLFLLCKFSIPYILFEHKGVWGGIKQSIKLVWGNWWRTFTVFLLSLLIIAVIAMLSLAIILEADIMLVFLGFITNHLPLSVIGIFAAFLASLTFTFVQSLVLVQFNDLKIRKQS